MQAINWRIINILKKGIINYYETGNLKLDWDAVYFFQLSIINIFYFFQKAGVRIISTVYISNRPTSIRKDKNHLPASGIKL